ncbi:MAG: hypothetical protein FJW40_17795 [Acidobacteria bacterium]|nr:hypothetical protein [Acidobacteriota bacterium]
MLLSAGVLAWALLAQPAPRTQSLSAARLKAGPTASWERTGQLRSTSIPVPRLAQGHAYGLQFSTHSAAGFGANGSARVTLTAGEKTLASKVLHSGDIDLYAAVAPASEPMTLRLEPVSLEGAVRFRAVLSALPEGTPVEREPNNRWEDATPLTLGTVIFASADDANYLPPPGRTKPDLDPSTDWYRFEFTSSLPRLAHFQLELAERDNLPVDISVFRIVQGKPFPFSDGEDPVSIPHEVQALSGNKFTTRLLTTPGTYYLRVQANHPAYKLRTRLYDAPPYSDPRKAVRAAADYLLGAGDSWHANTPRRGGIVDRVASVHQETSLCVACHVTHFSQRGALYAARNGYPVVQRQQQQFLAERFYNNPRPLYGFEQQGAVWARVISAPANVLGRMSHLLDVFEKNISGERRERFHAGVREYLKIYYEGRTKLPPDETNGNTPLVSAYEVAWYAWEVTRDPAIAALIEQDAIKNMVDLCYQTLALAAIDRNRHAARIASNASRILALQRPSGQWAMNFGASEKEAEFQTGHALWALHAAGIPATNPGVKKGLDYLLSRQQSFGGWLDPLQSYENFRTPFRETQMAVLALSSYFPGDGGKGWNAAPPASLPTEPSALLTALDGIWEKPSPAVLRAITAAASHRETLVRQQAIETLGRLALPETLPTLLAALGDPSKLVQRTAAWGARQIYSRRGGEPRHLVAALESPAERVRWGAGRIFATHFAELARQPAFLAPLIHMASSDLAPLRIQAIKGLWQFWFWTPTTPAREQIEDALLNLLDRPQHPWTERNTREAIYNLADENIRYLYNNWVPALAREASREQVIRGRLASEARLAEKFAARLESGTGDTRKRLLTALTEFHLRRADIYDLKADWSQTAPPIYNRIGNDVEQIVFFGAANGRIARAIEPLLESTDPELRRLATQAALLTRDARFSAVTAAAGSPGPDRNRLVAAVRSQPANPARTELLKAFGEAPPPAPAATRGDGPPSAATRRERPNEAYFRGYVQPILESRGADGYACVQCHITHTLFSGSYGSALNVVNLDQPEESLILRKPTSSAETEGTLGSKTLSHGGGIRWPKDSPEYNTILNWIRGAKP